MLHKSILYAFIHLPLYITSFVHTYCQISVIHRGPDNVMTTPFFSFGDTGAGGKGAFGQIPLPGWDNGNNVIYSYSNGGGPPCCPEGIVVYLMFP